MNQRQKKNQKDHSTAAVPHSQQKRREMTSPANELKNYTEPTTLDGSPLPAKAEGWMAAIPDDPTLYVAGVKVLKMADGSFLKLYKLMVKPAEVKKLQKKLKEKMRRIARDDREHAKRDVRAFLVMLGKA